MAAKRCPSCNLVNPATGVTCDCGYSFADGSKGRPLDVQSQRKADYSDPSSQMAMKVLVRIVVAVVVAVIAFIVRGR